MTLKEIKVGETYNVRMKVTEITKNFIYCKIDSTNTSIYYYMLSREELESFSKITPENSVKNSEPAPKYDPCRLFRKGDKVRVVERDGRDYIDYDPYTNIQKSEIYTVLENEDEVIDGGCVGIRIGKGKVEYEIPFYFLELVIPVEEPYSIDPANTNVIFKNGKKFAVFEDDDEALSLCARLNAELRKEKE